MIGGADDDVFIFLRRSLGRSLDILRIHNPLGKFRGIVDGCRQENHLHLCWKHQDALFPHVTAVCVVDVMALVENHCC